MRRRQEDDATLIAMETASGRSYGSIVMNAPLLPRDRNVFSDGSTRVDFVLVWEEPRAAADSAHQKWREEFLSRLRRSGLLLEQREVVQANGRLCFVLLSAPWAVLCYYAEELGLRAPLQVVQEDQVPRTNWSQRVLSRLSLHSPLSQDVPQTPPNFYTCTFRSSKISRFLGSENKETFFKTTQRHQVLYELLARTPFGSVQRGEVGVDRLVSEGAFSAAYPLHEVMWGRHGNSPLPPRPDCQCFQGSFGVPPSSGPPRALALRQILFRYWARWSCWRRYQPLDHVREYFGEKIALYFAWLGFYTGWLLPAALVGTAIFLLGVWLAASDVPAEEVCHSRDAFVMCPLCNICSPWNYSSICLTFRVGLWFDNGGTVFFSVFMSLWAVTFLEFWKRTRSSLVHRWDCSDFQEVQERPRPEFTTMAPMTVRNPVTGAEEPYFPEATRFRRTMTGSMVIVVMVAVVLMFLISVILYRSIVSIVIYKSAVGFFSSAAGRIASLSASVLNLLVILLLSKCYKELAQLLTRWEMHRTQTKYEDMFILKVFIFQFVNFYSSPVYIAFFKGRFVGYPGNYYTLFGVRNEDCGAGGCLVELAQELLVIMVGKQLVNNVQEFISPKLKSWWQRRNLKPQEQREEEEEEEEEREASPWEQDYQLLVCEGLFDEYLEMVLQFGFITVFVAACPLAPLFALVNNWVEIRLDARKFLTEFRRPVAERAQDIGVWFPILQFITHTAVLSNAFLIAFTSSFVPRLYYRYTRDATLSGFVNFTLATAPHSDSQEHNATCRYRGFRDQNGEHLPVYFHLLAIRLGFVIVFEHVVFLVGRLIDLMVPDVPEDVEMKIKREHYMAKEALAENQALGRTLVPAETDPGSSDLRRRRSGTTSPNRNPVPPAPKEGPPGTRDRLVLPP